MKWRYRDVWVHYEPELDGYGTVLSRPFLAYLRRAGKPHYRRCFEWCAGPGFIGVTVGGETDAVGIGEVDYLLRTEHPRGGQRWQDVAELACGDAPSTPKSLSLPDGLRARREVDCLLLYREA